MTAEELLTKCNEALEKASQAARNRMGCSENWYNPYYAIACTFSKQEISEFTPKEIDNLIRLGESISEGLW